ncbi:hypothetical protein ABK040_008006 [Willaertia magna]
MMRRALHKAVSASKKKFYPTQSLIQIRNASTANLPDTDPVVYHDELITTENFTKKLEELLKDDATVSFKPKYDMSFEEYETKFREQMSRPVYCDEEYVNFVTQMLNYSKEEAEEIIKGQEPKFYKSSEDGELDVDWVQFSRLYQRTETEKTIVPQFEREFKDMKQFKLELEEEEAKKQVTIDWADWERRLGSNTVQKIRRDLEKVIEKTEPRLDFAVIEDKLNELLKPVLDQLKDDLVEALPTITQLTDDLVRETPLLKKDEYGLFQNYAAPWFVDKYFPQERDELIQEIEDDDWDVMYTQQLKATRLNPDEIILRNRDWSIRESSRIEEEEYRSLSSSTATLSAKKKEEQNLYHAVIDGSRRVKELETEVTQLKMSSESEQEKDKAHGKEKKEEQKTALSEDEWWNFLAKRGVKRDMKQQRDFAHFKSEEQLKQWEETGEKSRQEAENAFFSTERLRA